jgi:RND superfamily putative drug exporter
MTAATPPTKTGLLARLTHSIAAHPWRTIGIWVLIIVGIFAAAATLGGELQNKFTIPNSDAQKATDLLQKQFPARAGDSATIVFHTDGKLTDAQNKATVDKVIAAAKTVDRVTGAGDPFTQDGGAISPEGNVGFVDVQFNGQGWDLPAHVIPDFKDATTAAAAGSSVQIAYTGGAVQEQPQQGASELIGIGVAIIILLIVFGTLLPALIPIFLAILAVALGLSILTIAAGFTDFNTITPILASMIGLGVGIDYSLFILTRFRQALHDGATPKEAAAVAASTAGRAVIFAGATVAISVVGLVTIGLDFLTKMGIGASLSVLTSVAVAVTLLPAVLALLGHKVDRFKIPFIKTPDDSLAAAKQTAVARWGRFVTQRAWVFLIVPLIVMILFALPVLGINLGAADAGTAPKSTTQRVAYDWLAEGFGPGFNGPLIVAVDTKGDTAVADTLQKAIADTPNVAAVTPAIPSPNKQAAIITVYAKSSPQDIATAELVDTLRSTTIPDALKGTGATAYVGGATAAFEDIAATIYSNIPWFLLFVVGITVVILTMAFRSVIISIKAALTTILSCAAAFGILTLVFQEGYGASLIGLDKTGPIESFLPVIVFALIFGLSMDYEVFLVSRIREAFISGDTPREAITDGVATIGRVIIAAALIMASVFFAFMTGVDRTIKEFGLALGLAIILDAFVIRLTLVPALMHLLNEHAWWIPRWLDRILPRLTIEAPEDRGHLETTAHPHKEA